MLAVCGGYQLLGRFYRDRLEREEPDPRHVLAVEAAIPAPQQLVATANRQERRTPVDGLSQRLRLRQEIRSDEELLTILAAAHVVEIVRAGSDRVADADRRDLELVPAPAGAARQHRDVPAVGVDVEVVRVEVTDADVHDQYAFVSPRLVRMRWRPSIAV